MNSSKLKPTIDIHLLISNHFLTTQDVTIKEADALADGALADYFQAGIEEFASKMRAALPKNFIPDTTDPEHVARAAERVYINTTVIRALDEFLDIKIPQRRANNYAARANAIQVIYAEGSPEFKKELCKIYESHGIDPIAAIFTYSTIKDGGAQEEWDDLKLAQESRVQSSMQQGEYI